MTLDHNLTNTTSPTSICRFFFFIRFCLSLRFFKVQNAILKKLEKKIGHNNRTNHFKLLKYEKQKQSFSLKIYSF